MLASLCPDMDWLLISPVLQPYDQSNEARLYSVSHVAKNNIVLCFEQRITASFSYLLPYTRSINNTVNHDDDGEEDHCSSHWLLLLLLSSSL